MPGVTWGLPRSGGHRPPSLKPPKWEDAVLRKEKNCLLVEKENRKQRSRGQSSGFMGREGLARAPPASRTQQDDGPPRGDAGSGLCSPASPPRTHPSS